MVKKKISFTYESRKKKKKCKYCSFSEGRFFSTVVTFKMQRSKYNLSH